MSKMSPEILPAVVSIATTDSGCGAGIQADLLTFAARNTFGTTLITNLTAQNPDAVLAIEELSSEFIEAQWKALHGFFDLKAIKTGMLFSERVIRLVAGFLREVEIPIVIDPVMVSTSGAVLLQEEAIEALREELLPLATVITPNLDEAKVLLGWRPETKADMGRAAAKLAKLFGTAVLLKGGHLEGEAELVDVLHWGDGEQREFRHLRIDGVDTHGSGCTLASAVAAELAKGYRLELAVAEALTYLHRTLAQPLQVDGRRYINH
ncbi:MAG: bifunctional hydroxymethylpyrimidine kinase/phosphomethylpyrimidine kinase [Verrucomicrobiota bacterium JB022]|nr:bifunctional hydroxymethylpyrimidine kinase/phosphomethylpyrimidine kinase [Verrucomicrobiota bacterium JB022]